MYNISDDLKNSITGNIEPAYIVVHDFRERSTAYDTAAQKDAAGIADGLLMRKQKAVGANNKIFRVQYNPSELELNAFATPIKKQDVRPNNGAASADAETSQPGKIELSATLWFDKMSPATSFLLDKNIAPTSVSGITNAVKSFTKEESVRDEVEGLIAAMRNRLTQTVTLYWADFVFTGMLFSVKARYTMFSAKGTPVRATAAIRVRQELTRESAERWYGDMKNAFSGGASINDRARQKVSNLFNLG
ncbi:MAG: hypothetical protein LBB57_02995 [Clostridiales Family XIII bacterium]|jgi:hypothetical protein|nr:hypothetical protein [Clostridiales Family XIII bacterium]